MFSPMFTACFKKPCLIGQIWLPAFLAVVVTDHGETHSDITRGPLPAAGNRKGHQDCRRVVKKTYNQNFKKKNLQQLTPLATAEAALCFLHATSYHNNRGDSSCPETPPMHVIQNANFLNLRRSRLHQQAISLRSLSVLRTCIFTLRRLLCSLQMGAVYAVTLFRAHLVSLTSCTKRQGLFSKQRL